MINMGVQFFGEINQKTGGPKNPRSPRTEPVTERVSSSEKISVSLALLTTISIPNRQEISPSLLGPYFSFAHCPPTDSSHLWVVIPDDTTLNLESVEGIFPLPIFWGWKLHYPQLSHQLGSSTSGK
jgi:hypothetical protein